MLADSPAAKWFQMRVDEVADEMEGEVESKGMWDGGLWEDEEDMSEGTRDEWLLAGADAESADGGSGAVGEDRVVMLPEPDFCAATRVDVDDDAEGSRLKGVRIVDCVGDPEPGATSPIGCWLDSVGCCSGAPG